MKTDGVTTDAATTNAATTQRGGCLCGAVRFTVEVARKAIDACHCGMCRRWQGGPAMAVMVDGPPVFADAGALGVYRSSAWAERCFCTTCGTALAYRTLDGRHHAIMAGALDDLDGFAFTMEIFIDDKPAWYAFEGDHPRLTGAEVMALFAGEAAS